MRFASKLAVFLAAAALSVGTLGCEGPSRERTERWATTENTTVPIDWDKINKAYEQAEGPQDFERRVNEIYEGDEIISVAVKDEDDRSQVVTGFFDKNRSGAVDEGEAIFTIRRVVTGEGEGHYQTQGYGPYGYYHSPMMGLVSGMLLGSMIAGAFSPRYVPATYVTSSSRRSELRSQRGAYRAQNPGRYSRPKASTSTGRTYGGTRSGGRRVGGGRFGLRRAGRAQRPPRLTA
jgi:hypothetical protein